MNTEKQKELLELLKKQQEFIDEILEDLPKTLGYVVETLGSLYKVVSLNGEIMLISKDPSVDNIEEMDYVLFNPKFILKKLEVSRNIGKVYTVNKIINEEYCETSESNQSIRVFIPPKLQASITENSKILLDPSRSLVTHVLINNDVLPKIETGVYWDNIGGNEEAKKELKKAIELPILNKDIFDFYDKKPTKGILLYGPPGCGKTMFGKAIVSSLNELHNTDKSSFIYVKATELLDSYVGESEAAIRSIFAQAKKHEEDTGAPAVIFIDEVDAILGDRNQRHNMMEKTIVPTFLTEMDGLSESKTLVIMATNRPELLDSAIVRDGRIDLKIKVDRPTRESALDIIKLYLEKCPINSEYTVNELAAQTIDLLFSEEFYYHSDPTYKIYLSHYVSGAMLAGIVQAAVSYAIEDDLQNNAKPTGVSKKHLIQAVHAKYKENLNISRTAIIQELTEN